MITTQTQGRWGGKPSIGTSSGVWKKASRKWLGENEHNVVSGLASILIQPNLGISELWKPENLHFVYLHLDTGTGTC